MNKKETHNDSNDLSFLKGIPKKNNFKVPADYFEELASKMESQLEVSNKKSPKRGIVRTMVINLSIAAAVIIGVFIFKPSDKASSLFNPSDVALVEQEVLVDEFIESIVEEDIEDSFDPLTEIGVIEDYGNEIAMLTADEIVIPAEEVTAEDITSAFEDDWMEDDDIYEF